MTPRLDTLAVLRLTIEAKAAAAASKAPLGVLSFFRDSQINAFPFKVPCTFVKIKMHYFFLRCGDRLLAVDGQSLENIAHHVAVSMLKRTSTRVVTEVVSWMGTEL